MSERILRVQGKGEASAPPDQVVLGFEVSHWDEQYGPSINGLNERVDSLRRALAELAIERDQLKTSNFRVRPTYEKVNRLGRERRELSGYQSLHNIRLELPIDREQLNRVLLAVTKDLIHPSISIGFEVKDSTPLRQRALAQAVAQARGNAVTLAEAAAVSLGEVQRIEYGWTEVRVSRAVYEMPLDASQAAPATAPDLEPQEVKASESVTMEWSIDS